MAGKEQHMDAPYEDRALHILETYRTWAVVGCSPDSYRASNGVARFLQDNGHRVIPVNPGYDEVPGERCYPDVLSIPTEEGVEVVDIFRRSDDAGFHVDEAIAVGAKAVWMQPGVVDEKAAARARRAGLTVVMDTCPKNEWPRLRKSLAG